MVLGLRKSKSGVKVPLDYTICIQDIKPWPPSHELRVIQTVSLQWENGDNKGSTGPVKPSLIKGKIEFNLPFKIRVTFSKDPSVKKSAANRFQKNLLEFTMCEPRRDRPGLKLIGTTSVDLAEYGVMKDAVDVKLPLNCRKARRNTMQPLLYLKIQPFEKDPECSLSRGSSSSELESENDNKQLVPTLMNEGYEDAVIDYFTDDDLSMNSSSTNLSPSQKAPIIEIQKASDEMNESRVEIVMGERSDATSQEPDPEHETAVSVLQDSISYTKGSLDQLSPNKDYGIMDNNASSFPNSPQTSPEVNDKWFDSHTDTSFSAVASATVEEADILSISSRLEKTDANNRNELINHIGPLDNIENKEMKLRITTESGVNVAQGGKPDENADALMEIVSKYNSYFPVAEKFEEKLLKIVPQVGMHEIHNEDQQLQITDESEDFSAQDELTENGDTSKENTTSYSHYFPVETLKDKQFKVALGESLQENPNKELQFAVTSQSDVNVVEDKKPTENGYISEEEVFHLPVEKDSTRKQIKVFSRGNAEEYQKNRIATEFLGSPRHCTVPSAHLNRTSSLQRPAYLHSKFKTPLRSIRSSWKYNAENGDKMRTNSGRSISDSFGNPKIDRYTEEVNDNDAQNKNQNGDSGFISVSRNSVLDNRIRELEHRVEMLEGELREVAAVEISLYSVVAEHGSSIQKVHTPARRISRLYIHASRNCSGERRASTARNAISGLVFVAKACGNDVPRLTFWLSNYVMLRTIITQEAGQHKIIPVSSGPHTLVNGIKVLTQEQHSFSKWNSPIHKRGDFSFPGEHDWEDPLMFTAALERIESWIFSRIVESIWWQTLAPHMQSVDKDCELKHCHKRTPCFDLQQANNSIEIWKKAIKDACGRLCPVRAEGHKCGCLPILDRLVMKQCIARLDVAMFNAILRESSDEMPTDPVSDPISDYKVLPIPSGKLSFGAGAQLKNAVGNWSRWLTGLIGMDTDDSCRGGKIDDVRCYSAECVKPFCLLNALSDLLMFPKDMLFDSSVRKEVCPVFSTAIIRHIVGNFETDDFCPVPIPDTLIEALDSEDHGEKGDELVTSLPCLASPIIYYSPLVTSTDIIVRDIPRASSFTCHTSDDELEELLYPLASMSSDKSPSSSGKLMERSAERYRLLREVWRDGK